MFLRRTCFALLALLALCALHGPARADSPPSAPFARYLRRDAPTLPRLAPMTAAGAFDLLNPRWRAQWRGRPETIAVIANSSLRVPPQRGRQVDPARRVKRALYVAGLCDLKHAFALFEQPGAGLQTLVIADIQPFGTSAEVSAHYTDAVRRARYYGPHGDGGVHDGGFVDIDSFQRHIGLVGPALLWELAQLGASDVQLRYIGGRARADEARRAAPDRDLAAGGWSGTTVPALPREVADVRFTLNGQRRRVVYVRQDLLQPDALSPVLRRFVSSGFDALLEKAPLYLPWQPTYQGTLRRLLRGLDRHHGLVVTDYRDTADLARAELGFNLSHMSEDGTLEPAHDRTRGNYGAWTLLAHPAPAATPAP